MSIDLTFEDVLRFQRRTTLRTRTGRQTIVGTVVLTGVIAFGALTLMGLPLLVRAVLTVLAAVGGGLALFVMGERQLRRFLRTERGLLGRHDYELSPSGLREWTDVNDTTTAWDVVGEVERDGHALYLQVGEMHGHMLPLRCFASPSEVDAFVAAVQLYTGANRSPGAATRT